MDINQISQLIGSLGFPIVCCGVLFYLYDKTIKTFTEALTKINTMLENLCKELEHVCKYDTKNKEE